MPRAAWMLALLAGCSTGLSPFVDTDTGIDVGGPDDTGIGDPLDTEDTDPDENAAPIADAGDDQAVFAGEVVNLDGSGSYDPDGDDLTYEWVLTVRPVDSSATLLNADQPDPRFYADAPGTFTVTLTVSDGEFETTDEIDVFAEEPNDPPVADAGVDQVVSVGDTVQLNGSNSYDPDGATLTFAWAFTSRPSGSSAFLQDATSPFPRFTADAAGAYAVQLIVNDGVFDSAPDAVQVTAEAVDDGDCGASCAAQVRQELRRRLTVGDAASGPALVLLPLLMLLWQRKRGR